MVLRADDAPLQVQLGEAEVDLVEAEVDGQSAVALLEGVGTDPVGQPRGPVDLSFRP
jgi:hypothetical protein